MTRAEKKQDKAGLNKNIIKELHSRFIEHLKDKPGEPLSALLIAVGAPIADGGLSLEGIYLKQPQRRQWVRDILRQWEFGNGGRGEMTNCIVKEGWDLTLAKGLAQQATGVNRR